MKKMLSIILLIFINVQNIYAYDEIYGELSNTEKLVLNFGSNKCDNFEESEIPTIFIPGILASWYNKEGYENSEIKRWIPDPITHSYDTLFYTFKENGYDLKDVFYKDEFNTYIFGNPKKSLYLFGYDWKKDNKITATILRNLILKIRLKYEEENNCDIGKVNIIGHSMGGLVARALLEDMCINPDYMNENSYYIKNKSNNGEIYKYKSHSCYNFTKINKLITLSTPHRGSPRSFPMWEKGNIEEVEDYLTSIGLKSQLTNKSVLNFTDYSFDQQLFERFHGFDEDIPNGIVTIGQLLPDVQNKNNYNNKLKYLYKNGYLDDRGVYQMYSSKKLLDNENFPKNSFLEELNKEENINKMWKNIENQYVSYYSTQTGNFGKNNIYEFELDSYYLNGNNQYYKYETKPISKDIYNNYDNNIPNNYYNINNIVRNDYGLGGDGTVPTNNLKLVPNDSVDGKEIINSKFKSVEMKCYSENQPRIFFSKDGEYLNDLYEGLGNDSDLEICSHTKTPIGLSIKVFDSISNNNLFSGLDDDETLIKERSLLLKYIGNTNYVSHDYNGIIGGGNKYTIFDFTNLNNFFVKNNEENESGYHTVLNDNELLDELNKLNSGDYSNTSIGLDFGSKGEKLIRYEILSPINIMIEDEKGRKIGIDPDTGMIVNEIPGAWTSGDTEGSREPEFFLIPRTGTGQIIHKIDTFGTGDGEYHIVMEEIKSTSEISSEEETGEVFEKLVIAGVAEMGVEEKYIVGIEGNKTGYTKIDSDTQKILDEAELNKKYGEVLEKIIGIIEKKYNFKKKTSLKNRLEKFILKKTVRFENDERLKYLVRGIYEYLKSIGY